MTKELEDYLDIIKDKYPHISGTELKKILEHGFNTFYNLTKRGADIQIHNRSYTAYCGKMFLDDHKRVLYNNIKSRIRLRLNYKYAQEVYNGIYYFGLSEAEWEFYNSQITSKRRNKIKFLNLKLYKIKEECFLDKSKIYFFELNYPIDVGWSFSKEEIKTRNFRYFAKRDEKGKIINIK
jgi:hypothetical protein